MLSRTLASILRLPYGTWILSLALVFPMGYGSSSLAAVPLSASATEMHEFTTVAQQPAVERETDNATVLSAIAATQVVYLGETHNSEADHAAQLAIVEALATQNDIAIGLEMFQRPFQSVLDSYLAGDITEAELIAQSEYETRWGYDWEFYAPIIRYAKDNQIPLLALNTPAEVTRQVATDGLNSLSGEALSYIPPIDQVDTTDEAYRASVSEVFSAHGGAGHSLNFDNFFAAQVLWDETMAERIVMQLAAAPERQVIVLVGEGHIAYDYGIPNRVERRMPEVDQASVQLVPADQLLDADLADFFWIAE